MPQLFKSEKVFVAKPEDEASTTHEAKAEEPESERIITETHDLLVYFVEIGVLIVFRLLYLEEFELLLFDFTSSLLLAFLEATDDGGDSAWTHV